MDNIKIIALDLDGTMLTSQKTVSEGTKEAFRLATEKGINIVPSTGRGITGIPAAVRELPYVRYAITVNGAAVWDLAEGRCLVHTFFDKEQVKELWAILSGLGTMIDAAIDGVAMMETGYYGQIPDYYTDPNKVRAYRATRRPVEDLYIKVADPAGNVEKFDLYAKPSEMYRLGEARKALAHLPYVKITSSYENNIEINAVGADKGTALLELARKLGYTREQTMAFGDGENDISMLQAAGVGVAMGNAADEVKAAADRVTISNDDDGVAYAIRKWCL